MAGGVNAASSLLEARLRNNSGKVMGPALAAVRLLLAELMDNQPDSDRMRLRTLGLVGSVMVFRIAHATVLEQMG